MSCVDQKSVINGKVGQIPIPDDPALIEQTLVYNAFKATDNFKLRPYLADHTGSRSISKVKLRRALRILRLEIKRGNAGVL